MGTMLWYALALLLNTATATTYGAGSLNHDVGSLTPTATTPAAERGWLVITFEKEVANIKKKNRAPKDTAKEVSVVVDQVVQRARMSQHGAIESTDITRAGSSSKACTGSTFDIEIDVREEFKNANSIVLLQNIYKQPIQACGGQYVSTSVEINIMTQHEANHATHLVHPSPTLVKPHTLYPKQAVDKSTFGVKQGGSGVITRYGLRTVVAAVILIMIGTKLLSMFVHRPRPEIRHTIPQSEWYYSPEKPKLHRQRSQVISNLSLSKRDEMSCF